MTTTADPIAFAAIFPRRQAVTPSALRLHASSAPMRLASAARASSSWPLKSLHCWQSNEQALRKSQAAALASQTRPSKSKLPLRFPHRG
jgi:hypothetical protein